MVTFGAAVKELYGKYAQFSGRSSRSEYWWVQLYGFVVICVLTGLAFVCSGGTQHGLGYWFFMVIVYIFELLNLIPCLALSVRRMHDIGKGGGWIFINFVPLIGWIWYLILTLMPSQPEENRFGSIPS